MRASLRPPFKDVLRPVKAQLELTTHQRQEIALRAPTKRPVSQGRPSMPALRCNASSSPTTRPPPRPPSRAPNPRRNAPSDGATPRSLRIQSNSILPSTPRAPVKAKQAEHNSQEPPEQGPKRWKNRAPAGTIVALFDAALEHGAVQQCLYQAKRMLIAFDVQQAAASSPVNLRGAPSSPPPGQASNVSTSAPPFGDAPTAAASQGAKQYVLDALRGRHQRMLRTCVTARQLPTALTYIQLLPRNAPLFTAFMKECVAHCSLQEMRQVLEVRRELGLPDDQYSFTALMGAAGREGDAATVEETFKLASAAGISSTFMCNTAMSSLAKTGSAEGVWRIFEHMHTKRLQPDRFTYTALITAAGVAGDAFRLRQSYSDVSRSRGGPDGYVFSALFNAASQCKGIDLEWLLQAYCDMSTYGVLSNNAIMVSFLGACIAATPAPLDQLMEVFRVVAAFRRTHRPQPQLYSRLLTLCAKCGMHERAQAVWAAMQQDGAHMNGHLYSLMLKTCADGGTPELLDLGMTVYHDLDCRWESRSGVQGGAVSPREQASMLYAFNAALLLHASAKKYDAAWQIYRRMCASGPAPDTVTINTLLAACADDGRLSQALHLLDELKGRGLQPTVRTYGALLHAAARNRNLVVAKEIFGNMKEEGMPATVQVFTSLMDAFLKHGGADSADMVFQIFQEMQEAGVAPSAVTYGCLLLACGKQRRVDTAFELYQRACDEGVLPTDECHNCLIDVCTEAGRLDEALALVKRLARQNGSMQQHTLNSLTRALSAKYVERALRLLSIIGTLGLQASRMTYVTLIAACARASKSEVAENMYWDLRRQKLEATPEAGSALIVSLCAANANERAYRVYQDMMLFAEGVSTQANRKTRTRELQQKALAFAVAPNADALASLVIAFARVGNLERALVFYDQIKATSRGVPELTMTHRPMWQLLIELCCRHNSVSQALQVFDDWKAAATECMQQMSREEIRQARFPKLSNVTLAFLKSSCRQQGIEEWRVYDVVATMRQQKERKQQARLPQPAKRSHHFRDDSPEEIEPDCSDTDTEGTEERDFDATESVHVRLMQARTLREQRLTAFRQTEREDALSDG